MTDGHCLDSLDLPEAFFRLKMNLKTGNCTKGAFKGLEAQDLNQVLEAAYVSLSTLSMTVLTFALTISSSAWLSGLHLGQSEWSINHIGPLSHNAN